MITNMRSHVSLGVIRIGREVVLLCLALTLSEYLLSVVPILSTLSIFSYLLIRISYEVYTVIISPPFFMRNLEHKKIRNRVQVS